MIHCLTVGHLDPEALRECVAVATRPLDEATVRCVLAAFPNLKAEREDGYVVLPWHGLGPVDVSEAFALRLHELTGCNDRRSEERASDRARGVDAEEEGGRGAVKSWA